MEKNSSIIGHISMGVACAMWGLMAPLGKDAMTHGVTGMDMVVFRAVGAACCFWAVSLFSKQREHVSRKDLALFFCAGMLSIVLNQCCFTIGLSITSPINASIVTTSLPIVTLILGVLFMGERATWRKIIGIAMGITGALILILGSSTGKASGDVRGDLLCFAAQCSFAAYLALFGHLVKRYSVATCMKWMLTFASFVVLPIGFNGLRQIAWSELSITTYAESAYVVLGGTFLAYLFMMRGQKTLPPTVVSMYNYVQPIVAAIFSVIMGLGVFGWSQCLAVILVFAGVRMVSK